MNVKDPYFPNAVWNGTTGDRGSIFTERTPDMTDWAQAVAEIIALEKYVINSGSGIGNSLLSKGFVLGATQPVVVGVNVLPPFTVPGSSTTILSRIRANASISGTISIRINIGNSTPIVVSLGDHENINITYTSGDVITVDVISSDGTVQGVTVEMEFLL